MPERLIFHVDVNSAFLSWEATERLRRGDSLDLRTIPSCIGGNPDSRISIVSAKSIPAKKYGITTGEPVSMALRKCPELVVVEPDFSLYKRMSRTFKAILQEYTPVMESFSIDEVFMDMTGMEKLYPDPISLAHTMKDRIRDELGFTVNVGIGRNKLCAKMASDLEKPDKVHTLFPDEIESKMWPLPVGELFGCGKSTAEKLRELHLQTIGALAGMDKGFLKQRFGEKTALYLHNAANGIDESEVSDTVHEAKSYSVETTTEEDLTNIESICHLLKAQVDEVGFRLRSDDVKARCITVSFRTKDFKRKSHGRTQDVATDITDEIYSIATDLMREAWKGEPVRLVSVSASEIDTEGYEQMSLIGNDDREKQKRLDRALDDIRNRYGKGSIVRAGIGAFRVDRSR